MNFIKKINLLLVLMLLPAISQASDYSAGIDYDALETPVATQSGDKIEILEFFWYGCPHCFHFEPALNKWKKDLPENVTFTRLPSPLNPSWMVHTKAYYTLQTMGEAEKHHDAIFQAMHVQKQKLNTKASIATFLASRGVNKDSFLANFDSFAVEMRARQALQMGQSYKVSGVPMLAINGKYTVSASKAGGYDGMIKITKHLIEKESK